MEIDNNNFIEVNQETYQKIVGAYFRFQRKENNISLIEFSKKMNINKGFLSDLENGKRHFPEGIILQFSNSLNVNFNDDSSLYNEAITYLSNIFDDYFFKNLNNKLNTLNLSQANHKLLNSLGFFSMLIVNFYHSFYIEKNNEKAIKIKKIIEENLFCLNNDELPIFYCFLGLYYKTKNNKDISIKCFEKCIDLCSKPSKLYTICLFHLVDLYSFSNQPLKAQDFYSEAKILLSYHNNFIRLIECEILECDILTRLCQYSKSESTLLKIKNYAESNLKNSNTLNIYRHLAWNSLLAEKYDDCIHYTRLARDNGDFLGGLCYFIPYSYYKKGEYEKALNVLNEEYVHADNTYKPFLFAIRARIRNKDSLFESHILKCYKILLSSQEYDGLSFTLNMMVEYYDEKHKSKMLINTFKDMQSLNKNSLTVENSLLLKTIKKKKR